MDFDLPNELQSLKQTVRRFVDRELIPVERESCDGGELLKPEYRQRFVAGAKEIGIWMLDVPTEYGGQGMGALASVVVWEELARTIAVPSRGEGLTGPSVRGVLYRVNERLKDKYLYPVLKGLKRSCFAQTEPEAGSDPGSMRTTAVNKGDHYVINGVKRFISGADKADFALVMAATDRDRGSRGGISCFLVDMDAPGVKVTAKFKTMMGDEPCEIVFDNVHIPADNRVGDEGEGFTIGQQWIGTGRLKHGARALGVAERCLELATRYATLRKTFGEPLANRQAVQWMLVDTYTELQAARLMVYRSAWRHDRGEDVRHDSYMYKYYADEMAFQAADRCMQIHGGMGLSTELPIEKMWRQQRSYRITEGATEVMKAALARHVIRQYG
jgi:acyl-CoA dehydrogenase